ncbi:FAD-binding oxidoreductase [Marinobacterium mangrovicola]|uniref:FAD/FMN-containing dehydrogenase n=1 Tax=Marinobacterium mangrovicola TaxID=1476959 RepID=A0A4R1GXC4_9GAMM|nr:FAD-binding oxidoreductase [Marinobacterium mangrovicola]TCK09092.1 FAD/FMN-containing dehydrogenase [Marinobacterium mangrovicola]
MTTQLIESLTEIVGSKGILTGEDVSQRPDGWMNAPQCKAKAIIRPANTDELSAVMKLCHQNDQTVTTHGGMTGLVGGAITSEEDIVVSLERMRNIVEIDTQNRTLTTEAGVTLQSIQEAAEADDLFYPVDLGARGSATIGGNIVTNAGGNRVLRYGMTRDSVLGLEAVLADGTVISSMSKVIKNNTGYDLRQLFIGSEGTLGIVTRAVLRLRPKPRGEATALVAVERFSDLSKLLSLAEGGLSGGLSSFEVMWNDFYSLVTSFERHKAPLDANSPFYVILETQGKSDEAEQARLEELLGEALEQELISDAILTQSVSERDKIWAIRDDIEALFSLSPIHGFDISLPIPAMEGYLENLRTDLLARWPESRMIVFGHLGDGNLHVIIGKVSYDEKHELDETVYRGLAPLGGSISAEHCIGHEKKPYLHHSRSEAELALMRTIKQALDPKNLLNRGKIFDC